MAEDFISGKHCLARIRFNNQPWTVKVKSTRVEEVAVEAEDGVNGEERDRLQKLTKYYRVTQEVYQDSGSQIFENYLANQANEDANQPQLPLAGGLVFTYLNGSKGGFTLSGCSLGPLNHNESGRTERNMNTITYRAQYFNKTP
jgi:hypothetical protein